VQLLSSFYSWFGDDTERVGACFFKKEDFDFSSRGFCSKYTGGKNFGVVYNQAVCAGENVGEVSD